MILSSPSAGAGLDGPTWVAAASALGYAIAAFPLGRRERLASAALLGAWLLHLVALVLDIGGWGAAVPGARLGFAPVLSITVWLVIAVHAVESRFVPLPAVRRWLAPVGALVVLLAAAFPGDARQASSALSSLHYVLGVGSYGLFGAAVLHGALLDASERRMRAKGAARAAAATGMPLLQLERLTFRFVEVGFVVLTAALALGVASPHWRWNHKPILSILGWAVFAALLIGRHLRGWRGRRATRWLYIGAGLLLLAYAGSRFVFEVLLGRGAS